MVRAYIPKLKINGQTAKHIMNLFYFHNHYVLIKYLSRSLTTQITQHTSKIYLCSNCGRHFTEERKFEKHSKKDNCEDPDIIVLKTGSKIEFKNIANQIEYLTVL